MHEDDIDTVAQLASLILRLTTQLNESPAERRYLSMRFQQLADEYYVDDQLAPGENDEPRQPKGVRL